jgi:hypothetical protein
MMAVQNSISSLLSKAARTSSLEDYKELFEKLPGVELFFNVITAPDTKSGTGRAPEPISTPLVDAGNGLNAVLFFTSKESALLKAPFGGIVWERALEMFLSIPDADGLIIQNEDADYVGIEKAKAKELLASIGK